MTYADRWLLPDGVEEILPAQARQIEQLRRQLLDLYSRWGYQLVIPPLMEFTDSLLIGLGKDLDLLTFKVTDQLSGRTLGIRADITPQTARMDAHSLRQQGANRLCYAGHVLYTKPKAPLATRSPIISGVELYGEASSGADLEVVSLLLEALDTLGLPNTVIEVGHVNVFRALTQALSFSDQQLETLFDLLQRKAATELNTWVADNVDDSDAAQLIRQLPTLAGDPADLAAAKQALEKAPAPVLAAVAELEQFMADVGQRYPQARLYFDLSEPHSFNYHTGLVFSAFAPGLGRALARGGRYDHVGEVFGRARPATGFSLDVTAVNQLLSSNETRAPGIFALLDDSPAQWRAIQALRAQGETVVCGFANSPVVREELHCDRQLQRQGDDYQVVPWQ